MTREKIWLIEALKFYAPMGFFPGGEGDVKALAEELYEPLFEGGEFDPDDPIQDLYLLSFDSTRALCDDLSFGDALQPKLDVYVGVVEYLAKISRGQFKPTEIKESWDSRKGPIRLTFQWQGQRRQLTVGVWEGYFDFRILLQLNHLLRESLYSFEMVPLDDMLFVCMLKPDEKLRMERERGLSFMVLDLPRTFRPLSGIVRDMPLPGVNEAATYVGTLNEMSDRCVGRLTLSVGGEKVGGNHIYEGDTHQEDLKFEGQLNPGTGVMAGKIDGHITAGGEARPYHGSWKGHLVPGNRVITGTWKGWFPDEKETVYEGQFAVLEQGIFYSRDPHLERVKAWLDEVWSSRGSEDYPWILPL